MKRRERITKEIYVWKDEDDKGVIYYKDGKKHKEDGPAVELKDGTKEGWLNGSLHREDGPALANSNGVNEWWRNGVLHREDGPAYENSDGTKEWFLNGLQYSEEEFKQWLDKKKLNEKLESTLEPRHKEKKNKI